MTLLRLSADELRGLHGEILEALEGARLGSEAAHALEAQLAAIDREIADREARDFPAAQ